MRAIILAAGEGSRLRPYTNDKPKCMVMLAGRPILEYQLQAIKSVGIQEIIIVTGYYFQNLENLGLLTVHNPHFKETGMVYSLMSAKKYLDGTQDLIISYADIVYERRILQKLIESKGEICVCVDEQWKDLWQLRMDDPLQDAETFKMNTQREILELGKVPKTYDDIEGQYIGLIKVAKTRVPQLVKIFENYPPEMMFEGLERNKMYMTSFLQNLIDSGIKIIAVPFKHGWLEIDTCKDLNLYNRMVKENTLSKFFDHHSFSKK